MSDKITISIIIPSIDGYRDGMLPRLLDQIGKQTFRDYEIIIKKGDNRQGRAINNGAKEAKGEYIVIMDDDIVLGDETVLAKMYDCIRSDEKIGMAGASLSVLESAAWIQKRIMNEIPRYKSPIVDKITESDFACHGCCIFNKAVFFAVGGEREEIIRGLDPDLRVRLRRAGYKVVLVPHSWFYHLPPKGFIKNVKKFYRNGQGSSYNQVYHPELIYETDSGEGEFVEKRSFAYRVLRYPLRILANLIRFRIIAVVADIAYVAGFVTGYAKHGCNKLLGQKK